MFTTIQCFNKYFIYVLWVLFLLFKANEYCLDLWNNQLGQILEDANRMAIYQLEITRHIKKEQLIKDQDNTHLCACLFVSLLISTYLIDKYLLIMCQALCQTV